MSDIITALTSIVSFIVEEVVAVANCIADTPLLLFAVGLSLVGICVHWFKMMFRA